MTTPTLPTAFNFRTSFVSYVPGWLSEGNAYAYLYTLEACRDLLCERAFEAMTIRLPGVGDPSNLPWLAFDRNLQQGPAEANASFSARLTGAGEAWAESGSAEAVLWQLQAYLSNLQPGVAATLPLATVVSNPTNTSPSYVTWTQLYQGTAQGAPATLTTVSPGNFSWDGLVHTWRRWLVLPMSLVAVPGLSGAAGATGLAGASACYTSPGQNVGGVWVPATSGTPVNAPWLAVTGLSGLTSAQVGQWIEISGSSNAGNNGTFQIASVNGFGNAVVVANPNGIADDAGPLTWSISAYPFIGPGPAWGAPGYVFGQGELTVPYMSATALAGLFDVTNGSASVFAGTTPAGVTSFACVTFASQPGVSYPVVDVGAHSLTLAVPYSGTTAATSAQIVVPDTGSNPDNISGVWQPSSSVGPTSQPTLSWGLTSPSVGPTSYVIASVRGIVKLWKSAGTYYSEIVVAFDCGTGAAGSAYSPNSAEGSGNPDGTFGSHGKNVGGVWMPTRLIASPWDCYCQGTGIAQNCSVENLT
jgi:hypothetical protein